MLEIKHRGTIAGLAILAMAIAWAVYDSEEKREGVSESERPTRFDQVSRSERRDRANVGAHFHSNKDLSGQAHTKLSHQTSPSQNGVVKHRGGQHPIKALSDAVLLGSKQYGTSNSTTGSNEQKLREWDEWKALRLGAGESPPELDLSEALRENSEQFEITSLERAEVIRASAIQGMTESEIEEAYQFLEKGTPPQGISKSAYRWLSDEILIALREQENVPVDFVERLSLIANNAQQDLVLRDYALQHLGHYHEESGSNPRAIEETLWKATQIKQGTIAGTALIALQNAEEENRMISNYNLQERAINILQTNYTEESKISALDALQESQNQVVTDMVQKMVSGAETPIALKIKARNYKK